ncbi:hypothetical protein [Flavobacterium poyangense]|uniref:hypothetical protein n=1 Tax=Flavobacterium poyangense TaxID=2204302 RepID=UPI0014205B84|nr:hypothetical protein [Flavobacterium sp. JXAS1]
MKLKIENWISDNNFSEDVNVLFVDAVTCYKAGANRASLLFSYVAFLTILKERIISGTKPSLFPQGEWDNLTAKLQNENLWEALVFESVLRQEKIDQTTKTRTKDPIFNINENLRQQIRYWKDRRNDCAHYKDNIIDNSHVESFWSFIESNLSKITIEGGMQSLLNKIINHFNPTVTPPDKDITPLIQQIEFSVERTKLQEFWNKLLSDGPYSYSLSSNKQKLISRSLEVNKSFINTNLISIIKENKFYLREFFSGNPDKVLTFNFSAEEVRKFWMTELDSCSNKAVLLASFLRNGLIPPNEITEVLKLLIGNLNDYPTSYIDHHILKENGFFNIFKEEIIENSRFIKGNSYLWVNGKADIIAGVIKNYPADEDLIMKLVEHYNQQDNSNWLLERFNSIFTPATPLTLEYKKILQKKGVAVPAKLQSYFS